MKKSELLETIEEIITEILGEGTTYAGLEGLPDMKKDSGYAKLNSQGKIDAENSLKKGGTVNLEETEDEDEFDTPEKEPTKAELRKNAGVAKIKDELAKTTKEMKELAKEFSKAEGAKKEKIKDKLKDLTKTKKDLEARLEKSL